MEAIIEIASKFGIGALVPLACLVFVGILAQWSLYDKCGLPGRDCVIPVKNVITFLKIMGRPASHSLYIMVPPILILLVLIFIENIALQYGIIGLIFIPWTYFIIKIYIELCQSFGHYKLTDYILCVTLNGFYVLHLGLSYNEKYKGPVYTQKTEKESTPVEGQLA